MKYEVKFTTQFKKDLKLAQKQGKNIEKLFTVIEKLANGESLEERYRDHDLSGNFKGCRECHIEPDWLLVYEVINDVLVLMLYRVGSHSDLFRQKCKAKTNVFCQQAKDTLKLLQFWYQFFLF